MLSILRPGKIEHMNQVKPWVAIGIMFAGLQLAACGGASAGASKIEAAILEPIEGTEVSRVILTADASERLGIATTPVRIEEVVRKHQFGAEVVSRPPGAPMGPALWIRVALSQSESESVDRNRPASVFPLSDNAQDGLPGLTMQAEASGIGDSNGGLYYTVPGAPSLTPGTPVLVELELAGSKRLIVPYGSVIYDPQGRTWAYIKTEPLVFIRHRINIDYIDGDEAFLIDGPPAGTEVVTVGAGELSGYENGIGN